MIPMTSCSRPVDKGHWPRFRAGRSSADVSAPDGHAAMNKLCHLIGLELGISVLSGALRGKPTGQPRAGVAMSSPSPSATLAPARRSTARAADTVWGKIAPAEHTLAHGALLRFRRTIMSSVATDLLTNAPRSRTINGTVQAFRQQL